MHTLDYIRSVIVLGLIIGQPILWAWILWLDLPIDTAGAFGLVVAVGVVSTVLRAWLAGLVDQMRTAS